MSQATPFDNILAQSRDLFCERLASALAGMLDAADEALIAQMSETRDPRAQEVFREARDRVLSQRETIDAQFRARCLREFQQRSNRAKKIGDDFADIDDLSSVELALVEEEDLNETLKFNAMSARLRRYCEEELVALDQRVGVLFGDAGLQSEDNPFAPEAISDAWKQTCAQVDARVDVRLVLLQLFDEYVLDEIRGIYRAVNALMVQNSILPKIRGLGPVRKEAKPAPAPAAEAKAAEPDFFALLKNMVAAKPAPAAAPAAGSAAAPAGQPVAAAGGSVPVLQGADLMRSLTRVQHGDVAGVTGAAVPLAAVVADPGTTNVLRELKATSLGSGMSQMDAMTLDIVALLFDQLFDDPKIPIGVKGLIGRLQIPILKVAIADKAFFAKKTHPARQMLDTLGEVAARLPADVSAAHPTFVRLEKILQDLIVGYEDNVEIFDAVREQLETVIVDEDQRIVEQTHAAEKEIAQKETLALAKTVAQAEIKLRTRNSELPRPVLDFLFRQWIKVLILIQVKEGEDGDAWKGALQTMDLLVWSVAPKDTREARREVVGKVPELLRRLADALTYAGIEEAVRARFFAELRKLHSQIIANGTAAALAETDAMAPSPSDAPATEPPPAEPLDAVVGGEGGADEAPAPMENTALQFEETETAQRQTPTLEPAALEFDSPSRDRLDSLSLTPEPPAAETEPETAADEPASVLEPAADAPAPDQPAAADDTALPFTLDIDLPERKAEAPAEQAAPAADGAAPAFELPALDSILSPPAEPPQPARESAPPAAEKPAPALEFPTIDFGLAPIPAPDKPAPPPAKPAAPPAAPPATSTPAAGKPASAAPARPAAAPPSAPSTARPAPAPKAAAPQPPAAGTGATPPARPAAPAATMKPSQPSAPPAARPTAPSAPPAARPAAPSSSSAARPAAPSAPSAARPAAAAKPAPAASDSLDMTAPLTVANPFGEGEIEVDDLDFTVQAAPAAKGAKPAPVLPANLTVGTWVAIRHKDAKAEPLVAKLNFVSQLKTRYLFVDRHGKTVLECSQAELVGLFKLGNVTVTKEPTELPLFDRLAEGVVSKLGKAR